MGARPATGRAHDDIVDHARHDEVTIDASDGDNVVTGGTHAGWVPATFTFPGTACGFRELGDEARDVFVSA